MKKLLLIISFIIVPLSNSYAEATSTTRRMSFSECLAVIRSTAGNLGIAPINIVETDVLRIVRFPTGDGSVLVTCSKLDNKMVMTKSN